MASIETDAVKPTGRNTRSGRVAIIIDPRGTVVQAEGRCLWLVGVATQSIASVCRFDGDLMTGSKASGSAAWPDTFHDVGNRVDDCMRSIERDPVATVWCQDVAPVS